MADNLAYTPGSGATLRTDDVGGIHYPIGKIDIGGDGVSVPLIGSTTVPDNTAPGLPARLIGQDITVASFTGVGSSLISPQMTQLRLGTGMGVTQASGNMLLTTGTTANADFLARSNVAWRGSWMVKAKTILSQRIANNNFMVLMADLLGSGLTYTNTTTVLTVTLTAHGLTSTDVGKFMFVGGLTASSGTALPGRYAIASITDANTFTMTVSGWTSGGGTCTIFGKSHVKVLYNGTTATSAAFDSQRDGWASGDTTITVNTTASPGHIAALHCDGRTVLVQDTLVASTATPNLTARGSRVESVPDDNLDLYLFLWAYNGSTAPASTTTWTVGFWSVEKFANLPVYIAGNRMQGSAPPLPVLAASGSTTAVTGTVTTSGTTTNTPLTPTSLATNSAATTNATSVKTSAGTLFAMGISNIGAAAAYVKLYNKASAPTVGTDTPVLTLIVPAGSTMEFDMGALGYRFTTGIAFAITNAAADTDTAAVAASQVKVLTSYV